MSPAKQLEDALHISGYVPRDDVEALREAAKANDRTFNAELRRAIRHYLEHGE